MSLEVNHIRVREGIHHRARERFFKTYGRSLMARIVWLFVSSLAIKQERDSIQREVERYGWQG